MKIFLCRHASAIDAGDPFPRDEERWLSARGRAEAEKIGRALARFGEHPRLVVTSPLVRAVQTAEALVRQLELEEPVEADTRLATGSTPGRALDLLADYGQAHEELLVVGHQPTLGSLAALLAGWPAFPRPFPPGALLYLEGDPAPGGARPILLLTPDTAPQRLG